MNLFFYSHIINTVCSIILLNCYKYEYRCRMCTRFFWKTFFGITQQPDILTTATSAQKNRIVTVYTNVNSDPGGRQALGPHLKIPHFYLLLQLYFFPGWEFAKAKFSPTPPKCDSLGGGLFAEDLAATLYEIRVVLTSVEPHLPSWDFGLFQLFREHLLYRG